MIITKDEWKVSFLVIAILMVLSGVLAQKADAPKPLTCSVESFNKGEQPCELSILRVRARLDDVKFAQQAYQQSIQALSAATEQAKKDNGWDSSVQFDMANARFIEPPKPDATKPETKK